ncbi:MAG TPA: universal stress protein [Devosiaceae bacterium]|nr:universal stress protein [Devosiaceae bacterium]
MQTILVAVDGSEHTSNAVTMVAELAKALEATLVLFSVDEPGPLRGALAKIAENEDLARHEIAGWILGGAEQVARSAGVAKIETVSGGGSDVARAILDAADLHNADMIVVGARGLNELEGLIMGSVSHKMINLSYRPVLVVK